jgi:hypothetical protein
MYTIHLKDKSIPIHWGLWAQREYCRRNGINGPLEYAAVLSDENKILDAIPDLILLAAEYAAKKQGQPFTYTEIDACEWIDEMGGYSAESKVYDVFRYIVGGGVELTEPMLEGEKKTVA